MVAERLKWARELIDDLGQRELDRLSGLGMGHVSMIESGRRPNIEGATAVKLARVLGVSVDWLLTGEGDEPTTDQVRASVERARGSAVATGAA
jgi:transcriptional regulator with XRE-family HTH domain